MVAAKAPAGPVATVASADFRDQWFVLKSLANNSFMLTGLVKSGILSWV